MINLRELHYGLGVPMSIDPNYSYQNFMDVIDDATTEPSHRHKMRRGLVIGDAEDITSIFVSTLDLFSHQELTICRTAHIKSFDISTVQ